MKKLLLCLLLVLSAPAASAADDFITGFEDLPLVGNWRQNQESSISFDTPQGRFIKAEITQIDRNASENAKTFYEKALPQLGWKKRPDGIYTREGEQLTIRFLFAESPRRISFELVTRK